jgi:hypothetical protein
MSQACYEACTRDPQCTAFFVYSHTDAPDLRGRCCLKKRRVNLPRGPFPTL